MTDVDDAMRVVRDLARELGLPAGGPVVIADRSNLVLHWSPAPIIARVAMATSLVRVGMAWLRREVEISAFLAAHGGAVTQPYAPSGPFERDGLVISFWQRETVRSAPLDPTNAARAGATLAELHRLLRGYEPPLPPWGAFEEARLVRARPESRALCTAGELQRIDGAWEAAERIVEGARARSASFQAVHGDAHIGNVLATERGVLWTDWEDACLGPIEMDLASLRSRADLLGEDRETIDAMTKAYGDYDRELVDDLQLVRNLQVIVWLAVFAERSPELLPRMRARIARLP